VTQLRIRACALDELTRGRVVPVPLPRGEDRRPREALVLLGDDGAPRAFLNRCKHLPIPIDSGSRRFLTHDENHLLCGTHGALYRRNDGLCVVGPCLHLSLEALPLEEDAGVLYVTLGVTDEVDPGGAPQPA
jgi:nitrite reductase/ring-hydroxylating ferredoxin subunit